MIEHDQLETPDLKLSEMEGVTFVVIPSSHSDSIANIIDCQINVELCKADTGLKKRIIVCVENPESTKFDVSQIMTSCNLDGVIENGARPATPRAFADIRNPIIKNTKHEMEQLIGKYGTNGEFNGKVDTPFPDIIIQGVEDEKAHNACFESIADGTWAKQTDDELTFYINNRTRLAAKNIVKYAVNYGVKYCSIVIGLSHEIEPQYESLSDRITIECNKIGIKSNVIPLIINRLDVNPLNNDVVFNYHMVDYKDEMCRVNFSRGARKTDIEIFNVGLETNIDQGKNGVKHIMKAIKKQEADKKPEDRRGRITKEEEMEVTKRYELMDSLSSHEQTLARNLYVEKMNEYKKKGANIAAGVNGNNSANDTSGASNGSTNQNAWQRVASHNAGYSGINRM